MRIGQYVLSPVVWHFIFTEEIEKLEYQLEQQQQMYNKLKDDHNRSLGEVEAKNNKVRSVEEQAKVNKEKVKELERILETKEALVSVNDVDIISRNKLS